MNGPEKSDSVVVAMKPANKVGQPAAERAEPRTGPEGNTERTHTRRTQRRGSVSQRTDRVRPAAEPLPRIAVSTRGRSRMPESGTYGSVPGAPSNGRPYGDPYMDTARSPS
jgi:hypothetical protein